MPEVTSGPRLWGDWQLLPWSVGSQEPSKKQEYSESILLHTGGALWMRHHVGEREARRHQGDDVWVSKEPSWRQVLQPQLPSVMMPGGSKRTSRWAFPNFLIPRKLSAKYTGHWKWLRLGRAGYAVIDHCNRIHLPNMLILTMASIFPHQGLYTVVFFFPSAWDAVLLMLLPGMFVWQGPSKCSGGISNTSSLERPSLTTLSELCAPNTYNPSLPISQHPVEIPSLAHFFPS